MERHAAPTGRFILTAALHSIGSDGEEIDLAKFRVIIEGCVSWVEKPGAYLFVSPKGRDHDVRVWMPNIMGIDSRLRAALKNFGNGPTPSYWLLRTLELWADPSRILILEASGRGYDVQTVTDLQDSGEGLFSLTGTAFLLCRLKSKKAWVPRTTADCAPFRSEVSETWLEQNFPGCILRLESAIAIGVSGADMASLLYDADAGVDVTLPELGMSP